MIAIWLIVPIIFAQATTSQDWCSRALLGDLKTASSSGQSQRRWMAIVDPEVSLAVALDSGAHSDVDSQRAASAIAAMRGLARTLLGQSMGEGVDSTKRLLAIRGLTALGESSDLVELRKLEGRYSEGLDHAVWRARLVIENRVHSPGEVFRYGRVLESSLGNRVQAQLRQVMVERQIYSSALLGLLNEVERNLRYFSEVELRVLLDQFLLVQNPWPEGAVRLLGKVIEISSDQKKSKPTLLPAHAEVLQDFADRAKRSANFGYDAKFAASVRDVLRLDRR